jgi:hypothetical protein
MEVEGNWTNFGVFFSHRKRPFTKHISAKMLSTLATISSSTILTRWMKTSTEFSTCLTNGMRVSLKVSGGEIKGTY